METERRVYRVMVVSGGRFRPPETLRPERGQPLSFLVEVDQRKAANPLMVFFSRDSAPW